MFHAHHGLQGLLKEVGGKERKKKKMNERGEKKKKKKTNVGRRRSRRMWEGEVLKEDERRGVGVL